MPVRSRQLGVATLVLASAFGVTTPASSAPPPYPVIYSFGDSLSDAGNLYVADGGTEPISPPYSHGRFSNGPVWVQDLARAIAARGGKAILLGGRDFAYGDAQTGPTSVHTLDPLFDLPSQLLQFALREPNPRPDALYTVWIGANDLFAILAKGLSPAQAAEVISQAVGNVKAVVTGLGILGARHLLLVTVPDLGNL